MSEVYIQYAYLIPLFSLAAFLILIIAGKKATFLAPIVGIAGATAAFLMTSLMVVEHASFNDGHHYARSFNWITLQDVKLTVGYEVNGVSLVMLVVVTIVALLVNIYSTSYMKNDARINIFYAYVALFTFSMLALVLADNLLTFYIFWELVGLCSFLLIGFWSHKPEARAAAKKAFIVTRVGDIALFIAIMTLFWIMPGHSLTFASIQEAFTSNSSNVVDYATVIGILIFVGAAGKSGQFPFHVWLPDAMEGPTPISALIHAATMVAAGVYLVVRTFDIFVASPNAMHVVAYIGGFTALFAATIALKQTDIKRVLAYSTVSQLGYMMMALGLGSVSSAMFHLTTHAFFKALLFLGAGAIIHAVHTQNINEMGGLWNKLRSTAILFGIGALALAGIPPLAGFWSKDAILTVALHENMVLFVVGILTALLTALYMTRLYVLVFFGKKEENEDKSVHQPSYWKTIPLAILAILTLFAGLIELPGFGNLSEWLGYPSADHHGAGTVIVTSIAVALLGLYLGWLVFFKQALNRFVLEHRVPVIDRLLKNAYYINEFYQLVFVGGLNVLGQLLATIDQFVIEGTFRIVSRVSFAIGRGNTRLHTGNVQTYGLVTIIALVVLALVVVGRGTW